MNEVVVFDIETGPLAIEEIQAILPAFDPESIGSHPGDFDESKVKLGRMTDATKINKKLSDSRIKHDEEVAVFKKKLETGEASHWAKIEDKAALSAVTGQVAAIGVHGKKRRILNAIDAGESSVLAAFWKMYGSAVKSDRKLVGWNIGEFDVPFLVQRSWIKGVEVPGDVFTSTGYLGVNFVDLFKRWACGARRPAPAGHAKLDTIAKLLGGDGKTEDDGGKMFWHWITSEDPELRAKAIAYLHGDLDETIRVAASLGLS